MAFRNRGSFLPSLLLSSNRAGHGHRQESRTLNPAPSLAARGRPENLAPVGGIARPRSIRLVRRLQLPVVQYVLGTSICVARGRYCAHRHRIGILRVIFFARTRRHSIAETETMGRNVDHRSLHGLVVRLGPPRANPIGAMVNVPPAGGHQWNCRGVPLGMVAGWGAAGPGPRHGQRHLGARLFRDPVEQSKTLNRLIGIGLPRHFLNFRLQLRIW